MRRPFSSLVLSLAVSACWPLAVVGGEIVSLRLVPEVLFSNPGLTSGDGDPSDPGQPAGTITVVPGEIVFWEVWALDRGGENRGLALVSFDLVQDQTNPAKFDLPPADGVPPGMANFARPAGITNPPEGGDATGYVGAQRGPAGARDLVQVGGAQNTFGQAFPGMGENPQVVPDIGLGGEVLIARGSFAAPRAAGLYTFHLANARANLLQTVDLPPVFSLVEEATVVVDPDLLRVQVVIDKSILQSERYP